MRCHEAEMFRHVADDNDLIAARASRLRQDQSMIDGSGGPDWLFGFNPIDGIQGRALPLMDEEWSIRIKIICECTVPSRYADTAIVPFELTGGMAVGNAWERWDRVQRVEAIEST
jgi:hypothetical protein